MHWVQPQFFTFRLSPRRFLSSSTIFCSAQVSLTFLPTDALSMTRQGPVMLIRVMLTRRECTFLGGGDRVQTYTTSHCELICPLLKYFRVQYMCTLVLIFMIPVRRNKNFNVEDISEKIKHKCWRGNFKLILCLRIWMFWLFLGVSERNTPILSALHARPSLVVHDLTLVCLVSLSVWKHTWAPHNY